MPIDPSKITWDNEVSSPEAKIVWDDEKPARVSTQPKKRTFTEDFARQLGLTARAGITGVTSVPVAAADFIGGAANLAGAKVPNQSEQFQKFLTQLGLPEPEGGLEQVVQIGGGMMAGGADPFIQGAQKTLSALSPKGFVSPKPATQTPVTKELHDAGYVLPPTEMGGGAVSRTAEGFGGTRRVAELAQARNQEVTQKLALKALKLPPGTTITRELLESQADDLLEKGYDPIRNIPRVTIGSKYRGDLSKIVTDLGGSDSFPLASRNAVKELVNKYRYNEKGRVLQAYTGEDALTEIKLLRQTAKKEFKLGGDPLVGEASRRIATALEDNIEMMLQRTGSKLVDKFRATRVELAKNYAVERMLSDPDSGVISTTKAAQQLRQKVPLTDELRLIAKAGAPMYARATKVPTQGVPPITNVGDASLFNRLSNLLGVMPAIRGGARSAVLSGPVQRSLAGNLMAPTNPFPVGGRIGVASPEQFAPLFSQGEQ